MAGSLPTPKSNLRGLKNAKPARLNNPKPKTQRDSQKKGLSPKK